MPLASGTAGKNCARPTGLHVGATGACALITRVAATTTTAPARVTLPILLSLFPFPFFLFTFPFYFFLFTFVRISLSLSARPLRRTHCPGHPRRPPRVRSFL